MSRISKVTRRYILDFLFRLTVFLIIGRVYLTHPDWLDFTAGGLSWPLILLWVTVLASMLAQLNANSGLTTGCLKQYPSRYAPVPEFDRQKLREAVRGQNRGAAKVAAVWLAVNFCLGIFLSPEGAENSFPGAVVRPVLPVRSGVRTVLLPLSAVPDAKPLLRQLPHLRLGLLDDGGSLDVHPPLVLLDPVRRRVGGPDGLGGAVPPLSGAVLVRL